ncbi:uncharacterized protein K02A2.6-like [Pecten maximus]|uniref:uncharacterized protein K02A2.6-like n=1 Tax=Pecten maximus TaxID=6579 RepID=UPI0014581DDD|nr:uncharacterized protein K02A2.6-like [Pecten maximus]
MFLLMVDAHSKWPEVIPMTTTTVSKTIDVMSEIFARHGLPERLVTDNGPQFVSEEFQQFMRFNAIRHTTSAPYHPRTNGLAERLVQTFKQAMKASRKDGGTLNKKLSNFLLAYRSTPHTTTNETPAHLFLGRSLQTRLSLVTLNTRRTVQQKQEQMMDENRSSRQFNEGETVQVRDYRHSGRKWIPGSIDSKSGPLSYRVNVGCGAVWRRHADQIVKGQLPITAPTVDLPPLSTIPHTQTVCDQPSPERATSQQPEIPVALSTDKTVSTPPKRYPVRTRKAPSRLDL